MANLPNLRRLFVEARTEAEENEYSRNAIGAIFPVLQPRLVHILCCRFQPHCPAHEWGENDKMSWPIRCIISSFSRLSIYWESTGSYVNSSSHE
ncbi:hypothetical protein VTO42DRAFT_3509 [Malbranchea cinnamomea]